MQTATKVATTFLKHNYIVTQKKNASTSLPAVPVQFEKKLKGKADGLQQKKIDITAPFQLIQKKENKTGLPDNLKTGIENLSGFSMDDVKVHYNSDKPAQLNAMAYAQGADIHIAPGYEKHLPHEAWHVMQQKQGRVKATMQMKGISINNDKGLEKEADNIGNTALLNRTNYTTDPNKVSQSKKEVIQAKKTKSIPLEKKWAAKFWDISEYRDLKGKAYRKFVYDKLKSDYDESLNKGLGYWKKLQDAINEFKGGDKTEFVSGLTEKRKEYDEKFQKNYVTTTNKLELNRNKKERKVKTSGLAAEGGELDSAKDVPYSNSVSFIDNSITAKHNYADQDEARIADEENKDIRDYEKRGLPNSEILWQQYKAAAQTQFRLFKRKKVNNLIKDLSIMKRRNVQNRLTQKVILFALPDRLTDFDEPHTWDSSEEEFKAVLGTPNCSGAAFLLADHVDELDGKSITDIQLLGGKDINLDINFG